MLQACAKATLLSAARAALSMVETRHSLEDVPESMGREEKRYGADRHEQAPSVQMRRESLSQASRSTGALCPKCAAKLSIEPASCSPDFGLWICPRCGVVGGVRAPELASMPMDEAILRTGNGRRPGCRRAASRAGGSLHTEMLQACLGTRNLFMSPHAGRTPEVLKEASSRALQSGWNSRSRRRRADDDRRRA